MNNQEAFEIAVTGVIKQGKPSMDDTGGCLYRGPNDLKCALGFLIPDDQYTPALEGKGPEEIGVKALAGLNSEMLHGLQSDHDNSAPHDHFVRNFKERARETAVAYDLDTKFMENLA